MTTEYLLPGSFWWLPACNEEGEAPEGNEFDIPKMLVLITRVDRKQGVLEFITVNRLAKNPMESFGEVGMDPEYHSFKNMRIAKPEEVPPDMQELKDNTNDFEHLEEVFEDGTIVSHNYTKHAH